jgi:hypothetical protein
MNRDNDGTRIDLVNGVTQWYFGIFILGIHKTLTEFDFRGEYEVGIIKFKPEAQFISNV